MKDPLYVILIVAAVLLGGAFACSDSSTNTTTSTTTTTNNSTSNSTPAQSSPKDIAGNYDTTGTNPDGGNPYKASLVVTPHDQVYQFSWTSGPKSYDGVGVMTDDRVAVSYTDGSNGKGCGVVLYKVGSDGSLDGKIGYWGTNTMETEKAIRAGSGSDLDGSYDISGKNPEGKEYKGKLEVAKSGDGYAFKWDAGNSFTGFGIRAGSYVAVGFGGQKCAFVGYDVQADGTLEGKWGSQVSTKFGTETAKPKK